MSLTEHQKGLKTKTSLMEEKAEEVVSRLLSAAGTLLSTEKGSKQQLKMVVEVSI